MAPADPASEVLADLLLAAVEDDRLEETTELLSNRVGEAPVRAAYEVVFDRLSTAMAAAAGADLPDEGAETAESSDATVAVLQSIRATAPGPGAGGVQA